MKLCVLYAPKTTLSQKSSTKRFFFRPSHKKAVAALSQAHGFYSELRTLFPRSRWAAPARAAVRRLREKYPDQFGLNTTQATADEADRLVREGEFGEAEVLYKKLLSNNPRADLPSPDIDKTHRSVSVNSKAKRSDSAT